MGGGSKSDRRAWFLKMTPLLDDLDLAFDLIFDGLLDNGRVESGLGTVPNLAAPIGITEQCVTAEAPLLHVASVIPR